MNSCSFLRLTGKWEASMARHEDIMKPEIGWVHKNK